MYDQFKNYVRLFVKFCMICSKLYCVGFKDYYVMINGTCYCTIISLIMIYIIGDPQFISPTVY